MATKKAAAAAKPVVKKAAAPKKEAAAKPKKEVGLSGGKLKSYDGGKGKEKFKSDLKAGKVGSMGHPGGKWESLDK